MSTGEKLKEARNQLEWQENELKKAQTSLKRAKYFNSPEIERCERSVYYEIREVDKCIEVVESLKSELKVSK